MLSFLFRLMNKFEQEHGYRPNVLYMNEYHFHSLYDALAEIKDLDALTKFMGMELVLSTDSCQPHVAWSPVEWKHAVMV